MTELAGLSKKELVALAEEHELSIKGSKADLIGRIERHIALPVEEVVEEVDEIRFTPEPKKAKKPKKSKKASGLPPVDDDMDAEEFVKAAYLSILKREADVGGLQHYSTAIMMKSMDKQSVLDDLSASAEAQSL